jgi:G3E family GTPase
MMDQLSSQGTLPEFVLLTGALGSGKTTLLSAYLAVSEMSDTGVIINDAGEVNVDGAVIGADSRDLALATLSNGCICCSLGNGVQEGIDALLLARAEKRLGPLRRIILETSGLAEPGPILRSLRQVREMDFKLRIVSTFDASQPTQGDSFLPHYASQLAAAQTIVLTKLDGLAEERWGDPAREARGFNPLASQVITSKCGPRARAAFDGEAIGQRSRLSRFTACEAESLRIRIAFARWNPAASWEDIGEWIENVTGYFGARLLRMKGLVHPKGFRTSVLVDGVGGVFSSPRPIATESDKVLGLMMILRDVGADEFWNAARTTTAPELSFKTWQ